MTRTIERSLFLLLGVSVSALLIQDNPETPRWRGLDANLYLQMSAEYRACCLQSFAWGTQRVKQQLAAMPEGSWPPAVVMDLDETVLDNSGFQADQIRAGRAYDYSHWEIWEREGGSRVELVPGALTFISQLQALGVQPIFITNRNEKYHQQTMEILKRYSIGVPPQFLLCANEATGTNKSSRRDWVNHRFNVLLTLGDNLRDFDEQFRFQTPIDQNAVQQRKTAVDNQIAKWGNDWIILPNPAYGEWNKPLTAGEADIRWLVPAKSGD